MYFITGFLSLLFVSRFLRGQIVVSESSSLAFLSLLFLICSCQSFYEAGRKKCTMVFFAGIFLPKRFLVSKWSYL